MYHNSIYHYATVSWTPKFKPQRQLYVHKMVVSCNTPFSNNVIIQIIRVFDVKQNVTLQSSNKQSKIIIYQNNPVKNSFILQRKIISIQQLCSTILTTLRENLNSKRFNYIVHKAIRNNGKQSKYPHPVTYQSDPKTTTRERVNSHQQLVLNICTCPQGGNSNRRGEISHSIIISI